MDTTAAPRRSRMMLRSLPARLVVLLAIFGLMMAGLPQSAPAALARPNAPHLGTPTLVSPANGSNIDTTNSPPLAVPTFQWSSVGSALYYELQVSTDPGFGGQPYDITTLALYHTPTLADVTYFPNQGTTYWRVRACDTSCNNGPWSAPFNFHRNWTDKPALQSPADGASLSFLEHPAFSWSPVPGGHLYRLRIATDSSCNTIVQPEYTTSEVEYNLPIRLAPGTYYWCVYPLDYGSHDGIRSDVRSFNYGNIAIPVLLAPANNSQLIFVPQMSWTAVKGATHYLLQYDTSPGFSNPTVIDTAYTSFTPPNQLSNDSNWYWRVAAYDSRNVLGTYSAPFTFRMVWNQLQPTLLTPNNLYFHVTYPYFQWTAVPDARDYELQIARTPSFTPLVVDVRTSATSYIITPPQIDNNLYYWRVIVYGADNVTGATSGVFSFKFDTASGGLNQSSAANLFYPPYAYNPDSRFDRPITTSVAVPVFQWQQVTTATNYVFTLGSTINMTDTLLQANTTQPNFSPNLSDNSGTGFNFSPSTIYYWRVQPQVPSGPQPAASQTWAVRVNAALDVPPAPLTATNWLQDPADLQDYVAMNPVFRWFPWQGANKYKLQIATDSAFSNIVQSVDTAFTATTLRARLNPELYYWRVQAYNGNTLLTSSNPNRLHIFNYVPFTEQANIRTVPGSTVATGTVNPNAYDLNAAYVTKGSGSYKFGLSISSQTGTQVDYSIPINLDYYLLDSNGNPTTGSGASYDPVHTAIHYANEFRPEYVVKFSHLANGSWSNPQMYAWNQSSNGYDPSVIDIISAGGAYTPTSGYVEVEIPTGSVLSYRGFADPLVSTGDPTLIGIEPYTTNTGGTLQDTVPDDSAGVSSGTLGEFRSTSDHPNPAYPFNTDYNGNGVDTSNSLSVLYNSSLSWYIPGPTYAYGFDADFALDRAFTTRPPGQFAFPDRVYDTTTGGPAYPYIIGGIAGGANGGVNFLLAWPSNTFYWRVRFCRTNSNPCTVPGSWSKPNRFNKVNIRVGAPTVSLNSGVPTFTWPRIEGVLSYQLDIANDPAYNSTYDNFITRNTSYTPVIDYRQQNYYYRLRASETYYPDLNQYSYIPPSPQAPFQVVIPKPTNLRTTDPSPINHSPTYAWDAVLQPSPNPVVGAASYELQTSASSSFNNVIEDVTTANISWTPQNVGYNNGTYFYRVRTNLANSGAVSDWTGPITYTKQYPIVNVSSGNATRLGSCNLRFTWPAFNAPGSPTELSGIYAYRLETASDVNFNNNYFAVDTVNASYINYNDVGGCRYPVTSDVYWRVSMIDHYGYIGPANVQLLLGQPTPTITPGGPTLTITPTPTQSGPTLSPTNTQTPFSTTNTPTPSVTPGGPTNTLCAMPFVDVPGSYWAYNYILYVYCAHVVSGIDGTHFQPDGTATRAQFARMVVKARGLSIVTPATPHFTDVPTSYWAYQYIETAYAANIVGGFTQAQCQAAGAQYPCFLPNAFVTRGQHTRFVVKAWGWTLVTPGGQTFTDVPPSNSFYLYIETAVSLHIVDGLGGGLFGPNNNLTRAQLSKTLYRSITHQLGESRR